MTLEYICPSAHPPQSFMYLPNEDWGEAKLKSIFLSQLAQHCVGKKTIVIEGSELIRPSLIQKSLIWNCKPDPQHIADLGKWIFANFVTLTNLPLGRDLQIIITFCFALSKLTHKLSCTYAMGRT
jgi:hypothetical protein